MDMKTLKHFRSAFILAAVFSCIFALDLKLVLLFHGSGFLLTVIVIAFFAAAFAGLALLYNAADRLPDSQDTASPKKRSSVCFLVFLLVWGTYYILSCPGHMIHDTGSSILFGLKINRTNVNNPFFQNFLFGSVYRLGSLLGAPNRGVAVYCGLQALGYAALLSYMIGQVRNRAAFWALTALYVMVPAFPIMSMTMSKDANFALALLAYTCLTNKLSADPEAFMEDKKLPILLAGTVTLSGLLRNHAVYLLLAAPACFILFRCRRRKGRLYVLILCALALFVSLVMPRLLGITGVQIKQSLSVPLQQTGYYFAEYGDEVTAEEKEKLSSVIDPKALDKYERDIADPIKREFKDYPTDRDMQDYFSVWRAQMKKHPAAYLKALYYFTNGYYTPALDKSGVKPRTAVGFIIDDGIYKRTGLTENMNPGLKTVYRLDKYSMKVPVFGLLCRIGIYTWMMSIAIARLFQKRRYAELISYTAPVMVFIGCLLSPVNGYFRYAFPMVLCVPLLFVYAMLPQDKN